MADAHDSLRTGDRIELKFPARGDLIVLARLVTSAISARAGFDIEELEDLRLAVGELCLLTLQGSDAGSGDLCLELTVLDDAIGVASTLDRATASPTRAASMGRRVPSSANRSSMPSSTSTAGRVMTATFGHGYRSAGGGMRGDHGSGTRPRTAV